MLNYNLQLSRQRGHNQNHVHVRTSVSLDTSNYYHQYTRNISIYRYHTLQQKNPLLTGVRSCINNGLRHGLNILTIKFDNDWCFTIYKNKGIWINGFKMTKSSADMIFCYMLSRHLRPLTYGESEKIFMDIKDTDLIIAETLINKLKYSFYNDEGLLVETLLNIEKTGREEVSIELNEGLWVSIKDAPFKSFMRACGNSKNKWYGISPEELYYECSGNVVSNSNRKLIHAFLEQNRHSTLVEQKSMELIEGLASKFPTRIKNVDVYTKSQVANQLKDIESVEIPHKGMLIKGSKFDWLVYGATHRGHQGGTQDVSTYLLFSNKNYEQVYDDDGDDVVLIRAIEGCNVPSKYNEGVLDLEGLTFVGPICIDQTQTDVSLGDQYAARALALLNDKTTIDLVSTLSTYSQYSVKHRIDFDAMSELSIK